ncbi:2-octaprenyl-6-methoxyphenyl hydroxylase [Motilimonas pumila]|uniref:2-octaprenyl-6-methoxyphenyl hydroxylase n=2 Tax=Motilimonas pumila TaxID=2303987 RepID=A0A418YC74_9GAMM|nr:2-octaprenyl-6-methoxyphenyl hydroxylase [Motilimonas pumila]
MDAHSFDVVIAGGGMAGSTLALALHHLAPYLRVALVEAQQAPVGLHPGFDGRSIALAYGSVEIFQQLNVWSQMQEHASAIKQIHVSDRGHSGIVNLSAKEQQLPALGYVIELMHAGRVFEHALKQTAVSLYCPASVTDISQQEDVNLVTLSSGEILRAKLLVGADGGQSVCRKILRMSQQQESYGTSAIIANVSTSQPHLGRAFERFTETGPCALLPMQQGRSSLVWALHDEQAQRLMHCSNETFLQQLQSTFGYRLGRFVKTGERACYPLSLTKSDEPVAHRAVLVGNAAHTLHPVAGQGFNLGLRDVYVLASHLAQVGEDKDVGSFSCLANYWQQRQQDHQTTITMTDTLARVFANQYFPLVAARNGALHLMDSISLFKQPLAQQALGRFNLFSVN